MSLSIIIPTISGREESLAGVLDAFRETTAVEHEFVLIQDAPTWPSGCNFGAAKAKGDVLFFGADDLDPLPGWHRDVLDALRDRDELPAARVMNYSADGEFDNWIDGADGEIVGFTRVPILTRDQYERIGPWPEITYYADLWLSEKARTMGIHTRMYYSYAFVHHWHQHGRVDTPENMAEAMAELERLRAAWV